MYRYDEFDEQYVRTRVQRFRDQVNRRLSGALTEEEFKPIRLMNGLYLQLHAYMLRVAIPYGTLNSEQMRQLAMIAERWDRGYGHFTTRQNIQFNWPALSDVPDILDALADVGMHCIQTSGNCIRNVTADHFAGAAADEIEDPRPTAELIRQWSTDHPEFLYLPRKFKIAVTGASADRAVTKAHDIGLRMVRDQKGAVGYEVSVGGGLGRTPMIGKVLRAFLPKTDLLPYLESILRVYNLLGRRDNKYKARIKILLHEEGIAAVREQIESEFDRQMAQFGGAMIAPDPQQVERIKAYFASPAWQQVDSALSQQWCAALAAHRADNRAFAYWMKHNVHPHRQRGYASVTISLKKPGAVPGDATAKQMRVMADLAEQYAHDELRIAHTQNVVLPHVRLGDLWALWQALQAVDLAEGNIGLISDIIACPGLDYCALATARSIPIAQDIAKSFADPVRAQAIGQMQIKISGCINACGHHHVGHIGILGLEKAGQENYQITIGGDASENAAIGERLGPGLDAEQVVPAMHTLMDTYLTLREHEEETFLQVYRRLGKEPFRAALYDNTPANA